MIEAYRKISRKAEKPVALVMPATARAVAAVDHDFVELGDGRVQLLLSGQPVGIFANSAAADQGAAALRRMGVAR